MSPTSRSPENGSRRNCPYCGEQIRSRDRVGRADSSDTYREDRTQLQEKNARLRRKYDRALGDLVLEADENHSLRRQIDVEIQENSRLRRERNDARRRLVQEVRQTDRLRRERDAARRQLSLRSSDLSSRQLNSSRARRARRAYEGRRTAKDESSSELDDFDWDMTPPPQPFPPDPRTSSSPDDDSPDGECGTDENDSGAYSDGQDEVDEVDEVHDVVGDEWGSD